MCFVVLTEVPSLLSTVDSWGPLILSLNSGSALLKVVAMDTCWVSKTHQCPLWLSVCWMLMMSNGSVIGRVRTSNEDSSVFLCMRWTLLNVTGPGWPLTYGVFPWQHCKTIYRVFFPPHRHPHRSSWQLLLSTLSPPDLKWGGRVKCSA